VYLTLLSYPSQSIQPGLSLDPYALFELKLVKQIVVASASGSGNANDAFVRVEQVEYKPSIKAKLRITYRHQAAP